MVIALVTLIPPNGAPGIVPAESRLPTCSRDIGGPAPDGFWIFAGGQRLLNTVLFVPAGRAAGAGRVARWRIGWVLVPLGLVVPGGATPLAIEVVQLELARIDRACDVTDIVDNVTGAVDRRRDRARAAAAVRPGGLRRRRGTGDRPAPTMTSSRSRVAERVPRSRPYVAGKPPAPRPGLTTYKLSSNENPYPPLPGVVEAAVARGRADEPLPRHGQHRALRRAVGQARRPDRGPGRWPPARWR